MWCEVCQQSETKVWCVRSQLGTNSSRHTLEYTTMSTASLANDRFAAVHWEGQATHQLTVDLARRAHQSPGRLVDEDGLRGLPLAQRTGQGQSGVVAFPVWELVRPPGTASSSMERGRLASCPSSPSLVSSSLFADKTVRADGVTHTSIGTFG